MDILDNIYIDNNYKYFILFWNYIYNNIDWWSLYKLNNVDIENFKKSKDYVKLSSINSKLFLERLINEVDKNNVLKENIFFKKWRLLNYVKNNKIFLWVIINVKKEYNSKFEKYILSKIKILNQYGEILDFNKDFIDNYVRPITNDNDILSDKIIEILWYYNMYNFKDKKFF